VLRRFREQGLDQHLFARLDDVREAAHRWTIDYNEARPRDSRGRLTLAEYRSIHARSSLSEVSA
jgi:putative transposase